MCLPGVNFRGTLNLHITSLRILKTHGPSEVFYWEQANVLKGKHPVVMWCDVRNLSGWPRGEVVTFVFTLLVSMHEWHYGVDKDNGFFYPWMSHCIIGELGHRNVRYRPKRYWWRSTHICSFEMLWKAGHGSHQHHHPRHPLPTLICIPPQQIHRWCNLHCTPQCPLPPGQEEHLCENAVHWLQLNVQHYSAFQAHHYAQDPGTEHFPMQLDPELPDGAPQVVRVVNNTSAMLTLNMGPFRRTCLVPSCTPCSLMTAWPCTTPTPSLSLPTTRRW